MATGPVVIASGSQSPASISRTIERIFDESQHTGEIHLSGRKLKKYPSSANKYDLLDTTVTDLSKNRFTEIPEEVCDYVSMERLNCYHNAIKCLPRAIVQLQNLVYLNLSRNQLSSLPTFINQLEELRVLLVNNNKLQSLPDEIADLKNLTELDVSCNELSNLPNQMCRLSALRSLNLRKNLLLQLPFGLMQLKLRKLDMSSNRIAHIPLDFHKMTTLEEFCLDNNPLLTPPSNISSRGLVHIMKYLSNELHPGEKKVIQNEIRLRNRIKRSMSLSTTSPENPGHWWNMIGREKLRQTATVDSGYNTTAEGSEKSRWSSTEFYYRTCEAMSLELERQKADYAARKKKAEELKAMLDADNERRRMLSKEKDKLQAIPSLSRNIDLAVKAEVKEKASTLPAHMSPDILAFFKNDSQPSTPASAPCTNSLNSQSLWEQSETTLKHDPRMDAICLETTKRIQKLEERLKMDDSIVNGFGPANGSGNSHSTDLNTGQKPSATDGGTPKSAAARVTSRCSTSTVKNSTTATAAASAASSAAAASVPSASVASTVHKPAGDKEGKPTGEGSKMANGKQPTSEPSNEEEMSKELKKIIESKLKIKLPQDIGEALQDGVILCHLANQLRPRSIMCIHIPSPAVPKLSQAKCRRNVDNFLLACKRMGLDQSRICSSSVILEKKGIVAVTEMIKAMVEGSAKPKHAI